MEKMYQLTEHVYILPFKEETDRPNIGYIKSSSDTLLFDVGCGPKTINLLQNELNRYNFSLPNKIVVSHFHWDHSFATGYINGTLIASQYTADKMLEMKNMTITSLEDLIDDDNLMPQFCRDHLPLEYSDVSQINLRNIDVIVNDSMTIGMGEVNVELLNITSPHCLGQTVAYVKEDKVLFLGDSFSACITGYDFVDNIEKRKIFYEQIKQFDFEYIVLGHFDVMKKEEFWKEALAKL